MTNAERHIFKCMLFAPLKHALLVPRTAVKAFHEFEAKRRIIELIPA